MQANEIVPRLSLLFVFILVRKVHSRIYGTAISEMCHSSLLFIVVELFYIVSQDKMRMLLVAVHFLPDTLAGLLIHLDIYMQLETCWTIIVPFSVTL